MGREARVHLAEGRARPDSDTGTVVQDFDPPEVSPRVDEDAFGDRLAAQAGAARAERQTHTDLLASAHQSGNLFGTGGRDDRFRREEEV